MTEEIFDPSSLSETSVDHSLVIPPTIADLSFIVSSSNVNNYDPEIGIIDTSHFISHDPSFGCLIEENVYDQNNSNLLNTNTTTPKLKNNNNNGGGGSTGKFTSMKKSSHSNFHKKPPKDPNAPVFYTSAFQLFWKDKTGYLREIHQQKKLSLMDRNVIVKDLYNQLSEEERNRYRALAQQDRERYIKEYEEYKKTPLYENHQRKLAEFYSRESNIHSNNSSNPPHHHHPAAGQISTNGATTPTHHYNNPSEVHRHLSPQSMIHPSHTSTSSTPDHIQHSHHHLMNISPPLMNFSNLSNTATISKVKQTTTSNQSNRKRKRAKDLESLNLKKDEPKALTAFFLFCNEMRPNITIEPIEGETKFIAQTRHLTQLWKELDEAGKEKYRELYRKQRDEIAAFRQAQQSLAEASVPAMDHPSHETLLTYHHPQPQPQPLTHHHHHHHHHPHHPEHSFSGSYIPLLNGNTLEEAEEAEEDYVEEEIITSH